MISDERVLITGAAGSIGQAIIPLLADNDVLATDLPDYDVTWESIPPAIDEFDPTVVIHLAAGKHAPLGEEDPFGYVQTNVIGTWNVLCEFPRAKVILTSTCKAADPETAYGATKLVAERMVLNRGGVVARLYNVVEASGNVFETWAQIPKAKPIPVTPCRRYFISIEKAADLVVRCCDLPTGRYTVDPGPPLYMHEVARGLYPGRQQEFILPRRGDRKIEPLLAESESFEWSREDGLRKIVSPHDPQREEAIHVA